MNQILLKYGKSKTGAESTWKYIAQYIDDHDVLQTKTKQEHPEHGFKKTYNEKIISYLPVIIGFIVILIADYITKDMPIFVNNDFMALCYILPIMISVIFFYILKEKE